ncbi:hypothetical protein JCM4914_15750 [Streptomyces platensis subsp. malvinus]
MQALGWGFPAERFAWAAVEFGGDGTEADKDAGGEGERAVDGHLASLVPVQGSWEGDGRLPGTYGQAW